MTHSVYPQHIVMELHRDGKAVAVHSTDTSWILKHLSHLPAPVLDVHGGPPIVSVPAELSVTGKPYYLGVLHTIERYDNGKVRVYRHFAFRMDPEPPFSLSALSDELPLEFLREKRTGRAHWVTFATGLALGPDDGKVYLSYGAGDAASRLVVMPIQELEAMFTGKVALRQYDVPFYYPPGWERPASPSRGRRGGGKTGGGGRAAGGRGMGRKLAGSGHWTTS